MADASTPHSRLDSEKALLLGLNALRLEVPSPVWEDIYERATAYVKEANSLFEQYEALHKAAAGVVDVGTRKGMLFSTDPETRSDSLVGFYVAAHPFIALQKALSASNPARKP